jgi:putative MFS transporter
MGCGMGALIMVGYASFTEFIPPAVRGKWSARLSFVGNWSPMLSAAIGVVVIAFLSWRMMFLLGGAAMLLAWYLSGCILLNPTLAGRQGTTNAAEEHLRQVESQIEKEKNITLPSWQSTAPVAEPCAESGSFWLLFKGQMLRRTLVAITVLIAMNISLYTITVWIPTIFVNSGIDVTKSILMTAIMMIGAPVGIFIAALIIDRFPRRLFGSFADYYCGARLLLFDSNRRVGHLKLWSGDDIFPVHVRLLCFSGICAGAVANASPSARFRFC